MASLCSGLCSSEMKNDQAPPAPPAPAAAAKVEAVEKSWRDLLLNWSTSSKNAGGLNPNLQKDLEGQQSWLSMIKIWNKSPPPASVSLERPVFFPPREKGSVLSPLFEYLGLRNGQNNGALPGEPSR